jgi:hypothetical protein
MNQTNQIITSDCGHTFCHLCFNNSISQNACPICTSQVNKELINIKKECINKNHPNNILFSNRII